MNTARDGRNYLSTFFIDGPGAVPYQINDIPHGSLNIDWYRSPSLKLTRRVFVYTPPGYSAGTRRYPVLYLLHGGGRTIAPLRNPDSHLLGRQPNS